MSHGLRRLFALAVVFAVAFLAVFLIRNGPSGISRLLGKGGGNPAGNGFRPEQFTLPDKPPLALSDVELLSRLDGEYAKLTEAVTPSVVSIDTAGIRSERRLDIFGRQSIRPVPTQGQGSGVIVSHEGHVVTNNHVVAGQQQIQVRLHDGRVFPATLVGTDDMLDVAVLKIESKEKETNFQPLKFGDSTQVRRGQIVFAIGNPFGLGETITQGIISAVERSLSDTQRDLFQTDAAINPGNSGGPLVNLQGEIIGINSAIYSPDRANPGFQGVGFSIPSNDVKDTLYAILERGRPIRGYFGVRMLDLDPRVRDILGYSGEGAVVIGVGPDSPAEKAGLEERDVILSYDGQAIRSTNQLIVLVQRTKIGRKVPLKIWRAGAEQTLEAEIVESTPDTPQVPMPGQGKTRDRDEVLTAMGVAVRDLSVGERQHGFSGVVVATVQAGALAADRLQPGDLVVAVNQNPVTNSMEFYQHLASSAAVQQTTVHFIRNGDAMRADLPVLPRKEEKSEDR